MLTISVRRLRELEGERQRVSSREDEGQEGQRVSVREDDGQEGQGQGGGGRVPKVQVIVEGN